MDRLPTFESEVSSREKAPEWKVEA